MEMIAKTVRLQDRRHDLHRRALRADLHRGRRVGERDVGLPGGDELSRGRRALALLDREVDAGVLVEAELLRVHEPGLRAAGQEIERQLIGFPPCANAAVAKSAAASPMRTGRASVVNE
jgi:hypothetical protein